MKLINNDKIVKGIIFDFDNINDSIFEIIIKINIL